MPQHSQRLSLPAHIPPREPPREPPVLEGHYEEEEQEGTQPTEPTLVLAAKALAQARAEAGYVAQGGSTGALGQPIPDAHTALIAAYRAVRTSLWALSLQERPHPERTFYRELNESLGAVLTMLARTLPSQVDPQTGLPRAPLATTPPLDAFGRPAPRSRPL